MSAFTLSNLPLPLVMRPGPSEKTSNKNGTVFTHLRENDPIPGNIRLAAGPFANMRQRMSVVKTVWAE